VRIRLEGSELPGITCGPGPEHPGGHPNTHVGGQRRNKPGESLDATCDGFDLKGSHIEGSPDGRFAYP
jgi:hypothetical protein